MTLATSIILTLGYSAQFGQPLNVNKLYQRLITPQKKLLSLNQLNQVLKLLVKQKLISEDKDLYTLWGFEDNFVAFPKKNAQSQLYWQQTPKVVQFCKKIPWITGVAITGSLAVNNSQKKDDIDFMIVTKPNRLWLTRFIVTFYTIIMGKKRGRGIAGGTGWCFNLWLEEGRLGLPKFKQSLYSAYELTQATWLLATKVVLKKVWVKNPWVFDLTPFNHLAVEKVEIIPSKTVAKSINFFTTLFDWFNFIFLAIQQIYMSGHKTTELVTNRSAFFHPLNTKKKIYHGLKNCLLAWQKNISPH